MPTTGAPWNIYYPDNTAPISPIENLFSTMATSVASALTAFQSKAPYLVTTPASLDVIADASAGSIAYMSTPGTGITAMNWRGLSTGSGVRLNWQIEDDVLVADTKAHLDSFIAVIAGLSGLDLNFKVGAFAFVTGTGLIYRFTNTAGGLHLWQSGEIPIKPSAVAGTNVVLGSDGKVTVASAGGTSMSIQGCFPTDFSQFRVAIPQLLVSGTANLQVQLMSGASAIATATYQMELGYRVGTTWTTPAATTGASQITVNGLNGGPDKFGDIYLYRVSQAARTTLRWHFGEDAAAGGGPGQVLGIGRQSDAVAYDGIRLLVSAGTISAAEVQVFGSNPN